MIGLIFKAGPVYWAPGVSRRCRPARPAAPMTADETKFFVWLAVIGFAGVVFYALPSMYGWPGALPGVGIVVWVLWLWKQTARPRQPSTGRHRQ